MESTANNNPFELHVLLIDSAINNWRPDIIDMAAEIENRTGQLLGMSPDDKGPISLADCDQRKELMTLDEGLIDALLSIKATSDTVKSLLGYFRSATTTSTTSASNSVVEFSFGEQIRDLDLLEV